MMATNSKVIFLVLVSLLNGCIIKECATQSTFSLSSNELNSIWRQEVVPEIVDKCPEKALHVDYVTTGVSAKFGNLIKPTQARDEPKFRYEAEPDSLYTIVMVDADSPTRLIHLNRNALHFVKNNIPGGSTKEGDVAVEYVPPMPFPATGQHRIVFLLYKQADGNRVDVQSVVKKNQIVGRNGVDLRQYAADNRLGEPIAINFQLSDWDLWVQGVLAQFL